LGNISGNSTLNIGTTGGQSDKSQSENSKGSFLTKVPNSLQEDNLVTVKQPNATQKNNTKTNPAITESNTTASPETNATEENAPLQTPESNATLTPETNATEENAPLQTPESNATLTPETNATEENAPTPSPETNATQQLNNATFTNLMTNGTISNASQVGGVDILVSPNASADQPLSAAQEPVSNVTSLEGSSGSQISSDTLDQTTPPEDTLGPKVANQTDTIASSIAGVSSANSNIENDQLSNIQNVINNIAISASQSGGNSQKVVDQISKDVAANPKGPVANSINQLANEFAQGNVDEVNIAANQIGNLVAKGNNIQQTLVQITNKVVNNIKSIKASEDNFEKVIIHPSTTSVQKTEIKQTVDTIKKGKQEVDVPRVHIKFSSHERSLVLRILTTNNYRYEMPFSKFNGAFSLNDNEFRVKILSGDGKISAASVAPMFKSGKVGDRNFLDKDVKNGKVFFSLKGVKDGQYLLEVYIKLSNGSIGTFARGSVSIK